MSFLGLTTVRLDGGGQLLGESSFGQMKDVTERIFHPHGEGSLTFVHFSVEDHEHLREAQRRGLVPQPFEQHERRVIVLVHSNDDGGRNAACAKGITQMPLRD